MSINLTGYTSVQTAYFVKLDIPDYDILYFSNFDRAYTISGETYSNLGSLMGITDSQSEIRSTSHELTVTISGVPSGSIAEIIDNKVKGSRIVIKRAFFTAQGQILNITGNPAVKFSGIVNNVSFTEEWDQAAKLSKFTIGFICSGNTNLLAKKIAGRRTNPVDQKLYYASDVSMDRIPNIANSSFNFGKPR